MIKTMGAEIRCGVEVEKGVTLEELRGQGYKAFFVAIGLQAGRKAGIPGEDAENVETGIDFLRRVNLDLLQKISGRTVVVGGGNVLRGMQEGIPDGRAWESVPVLPERAHMAAFGAGVQYQGIGG